MRRFFLKALLFSLLLWGGLLAACVWLPNPRAGVSMLGALLDKHARLAAAGTNRVILVGGSGLPMGMRSGLLATQLGRPVINMGVHAGLGLRFMLQDAERFARPGDTFVVVPEYDHFFTSLWYGDEELVATVMDVAPDTRALISFRQWLALAEHMPTYAATKVRHALIRALGLSRIESWMPRGCYRVDFDADGDLRNPPEQSPGLARRPNRSGREKINPVAIAGIIAFRDYLTARGARCIVLPPAYQASAFDADARVIAAIGAALQRAGLGFAAPPQRYRLANELFTDSANHLTRAGCALRTQMVAEDLRACLSGGQPGGNAPAGGGR